MLTLADRRIRNIAIAENGESFVNLATFSQKISVDLSRTLISSRSEFFLFARKTVAERLLIANEALPTGLQLLVTEAYRPLSQQRASFQRYVAKVRGSYPGISDDEVLDIASRYVAPPDVAGHPTGAAVDLTLQQTGGSHVEMGSVLNAMDSESSGACYTACTFIPKTATANRKILANAMERAGFVNYPSEWWHWSYGDRYWAVVTQQAQAVYGPVEEDSVA
ncbi:M15 family metallopeptidase [Caballeronia sordidicola]|nr:M15 family metallopeptidase [Caballeronia sordidicola]